MASKLPRPAVAFLRRFADDERGVQFIWFAMALPVLFGIGGFGMEDANFAAVNLKVSQYALNLADNASRVGVDAGSGVTSLREADINDVLQGMRLDGDDIRLTTYGRVTLSSLENVKQSYDSGPVQRIHWQRCMGKIDDPDFASSYGKTSTSAGSTDSAANAGLAKPNGMGDADREVKAPKDGGVMFVEVNYIYQPLFGTLYFKSPKRIHYIASFIVRDNRNFTRIYNLTPAATPSKCDLYTKGPGGQDM